MCVSVFDRLTSQSMGRHEAHGTSGEEGYNGSINIVLHRKKLERLSAVEDIQVEVSVSELERAIQERGLDQVMVVRSDEKDELNMMIPEDRLGFDVLERYVDPSLEIPTIDVETQGEGPMMSLRDLKAYFDTPEKNRSRLLNVVSFNLGYTALDGYIVPPAVVRDMDVVGRCWPSGDARYQKDDNPFSETHMRKVEEAYSCPKTLAYLLMGPAGAYTDWHVDMGGSSVWYHVIRGSKIFMAAPDTEHNRNEFVSWSSSEEQVEFLGDRLEKCVRLRLMAGDTLFLPGGWFHAVSTPMDSLVVGGNFINVYRLKNALGVVDIERRLRIDSDAHYPKFKMLMYYAACDLVRRSQRGRALYDDGAVHGVPGLSEMEIKGLPYLADYLEHFAKKRRRNAKQRQMRTIVDILRYEIERYNLRDGEGDDGGDASSTPCSTEKAKENKQPSPEIASLCNEDQGARAEVGQKKTSTKTEKKRKIRDASVEGDSIIDLTKDLLVEGEEMDSDPKPESEPQRGPHKKGASTKPASNILLSKEASGAPRKEASRNNGFFPKYSEKVFAGQNEDVRMRALQIHAAVASNLVQEKKVKQMKQSSQKTDSDSVLRKAVERRLINIEKLVRQLESDRRVYAQHVSGEILLKDRGEKIRNNVDMLSKDLNKQAKEFAKFVEDTPEATGHVTVLKPRFSKTIEYLDHEKQHHQGHREEHVGNSINLEYDVRETMQPHRTEGAMAMQFRLTKASPSPVDTRIEKEIKQMDGLPREKPQIDRSRHLNSVVSAKTPEQANLNGKRPPQSLKTTGEDTSGADMITRASTPNQIDAPKQTSTQRPRNVMDSRTLRVALNVLRQENRYMTPKEITRFALEQGMLDFRSDLGDCIGFELSVESQVPNSRITQVNCRYGLKDWKTTP